MQLAVKADWQICARYIYTVNVTLKQGDISSLFAFNFSFVYAIRKVQENQEGLKFNASYGVLSVT
jgi:hypothetical protein